MSKASFVLQRPFHGHEVIKPFKPGLSEVFYLKEVLDRREPPPQLPFSDYPPGGLFAHARQRHEVFNGRRVQVNRVSWKGGSAHYGGPVRGRDLRAVIRVQKITEEGGPVKRKEEEERGGYEKAGGVSGVPLHPLNLFRTRTLTSWTFAPPPPPPPPKKPYLLRPPGFLSLKSLYSRLST